MFCRDAIVHSIMDALIIITIIIVQGLLLFVNLVVLENKSAWSMASSLPAILPFDSPFCILNNSRLLHDVHGDLPLRVTSL